MPDKSNDPPDCDGPQPDKFYNVRAVAEKLGLSERHVWRMIAGGVLRPNDFGGATRISGQQLIDLKRRTTRPQPKKSKKTPAPKKSKKDEDNQYD